MADDGKGEYLEANRVSMGTPLLASMNCIVHCGGALLADSLTQPSPKGRHQSRGSANYEAKDRLLRQRCEAIPI
jgi:hypothetical protein